MPKTVPTRSLPLVAAALLGLSLVVAPATAQTVTQRGIQSGNNTRNQNQNPPPMQRQPVNVPAVDTAALDQAKKDDAAAKADEKKALAAVSAAHGKLMKGFDGKPEVVEANKKIAAAKEAYAAASAPLLKALEATPEYKAKQQAVVTADQDVTTFRADPNATPQQRMDAAKKALEARNAVSQARTDAVAGNAEVSKAKSDLDGATAALNNCGQSSRTRSPATPTSSPPSRRSTRPRPGRRTPTASSPRHRRTCRARSRRARPRSPSSASSTAKRPSRPASRSRTRRSAPRRGHGNRPLRQRSLSTAGRTRGLRTRAGHPQ
jgi:hypothetical protein